MNNKAKKVSKFFVVLFVFLLAFALVLGSTGAYYNALRKASGTIQMQKGIVIRYTGFGQNDVEWTKANATSFELFANRSAIPGEEIDLVLAQIKADTNSIDFYARAKIEYTFDGTNAGEPVTNIPLTASDLITADVFNSNWKLSNSGDGWYYYVQTSTYGTFTAGGAYQDIFKSGAKLTIEGNNFTGATGNGSGGGFVVDGTDYIVTTINASLVIEAIQADSRAATDMGWNYTETVTPAPATYTDSASGVEYELNEQGTGYTVTGGTIAGGSNGGSVSGYSAKIGNTSASTYETAYTVTILSYIHNLPVTKIAANATFTSDYYITIIIPVTIVEIGAYAFDDLNGNYEVAFETGRTNVITIGTYAIPNGTALPNGESYSESAGATDVPELYTITLSDGTGSLGSFWNELDWNNTDDGVYTKSFAYNTSLPLPQPTYDGWTFNYWTDGVNNYTGSITVTSDITLTAVWTENGSEPEPTTYTLTLIDNTGSYDDFWSDLESNQSWSSDMGGSPYTKSLDDQGGGVNLPTPTASGYTFQYWTDGDNTYNGGEWFTMPSHDVTLTAVWTANGSEPSGDTYTITLYAGSSYYEGMTWGNWSCVDSSEDYYIFTYSGISSGSSVNLPYSDNADGYWSYSREGSADYSEGENITVNGDMTLYFVADNGGSGDTYTVYLYLDEGEYEYLTGDLSAWTVYHHHDEPSEPVEYLYQTVSSGDSITLPNANTAARWNLENWGEYYSLGSSYSVYEGRSFYFETVQTYTITLDLNDNSAHVSSLDGWTGENNTYTKTIAEGENYTLPGVDANYYWYYSNDNYYAEGGYNNSAWDSRTFVLTYVSSYTATLHLGDGEFSTDFTENNSDYNYFTNAGNGTYTRSFNRSIDKTWSLPDSSSYFTANTSGYVFYGWYFDSSFTNPADSYEWYEEANSNVDLYAKYGLEYITVYFDVNGGSDDEGRFSNYSISYDDELGKYVWNERYDNGFDLPTLTKSGYAFVGWFENSSFTGTNWFDYDGGYFYPKYVASGTTLYAKYYETYTENNIIFGYDDLASAWIVMGVTDQFSSTTLTIPSSVNGNDRSGNVIKINKKAFYFDEKGDDQKNYTFTSVVLPATLVEIGEYAFAYNYQLTTVSEIPASVTTIGKRAFHGCDALTGFTVNASNANYSSYDGVLYNKAKTQIIEMPEGNAGTNGTVRIPSTITTIDTYLSGAFENLVFQGDVEFTEKEWGEDLDNIQTITFTNTDPSNLGSRWTESCIHENIVVFVPSASVSAYQAVFDDEYEMNGEDGYTWTAVAVGTDIAPTNTSLSGVTENAGVYTYTDSNGIVYTLNDDNKTYTLTDATSASLSDSTIRIECAGPYGIYKVTAIGANAFKDITDSFGVRISDNITSIGANAFSGCTNMNMDDDSLYASSIGDYAFYNCSSLNSKIYFYVNGAATIGAHAFDGVGSLDYIRFAAHTKGQTVSYSIGEYAFANMTASSEDGIQIRIVGEDGSTVNVTVAANAFNGTKIRELELGSYDESSHTNITFSANALNGANIVSLLTYFDTVPTGLTNAGLSTSTIIYAYSDSAVTTYETAFPNNTVENYRRKGHPNYTDSYGVVYRYMEYDADCWGYVVYSTTNAFDSTSYTVNKQIETNNGTYEVYGFESGVFADTAVTDIYITGKSGDALWNSFNNLPVTNTNTGAITYHVYASVYDSMTENYSSYTFASVAEPYKLIIADTSDYYNGLDGFENVFEDSIGDSVWVKEVSSSDSPFTLPSSNGNYGENYVLTWTVDIYDVNDGWTEVGSLAGGATFDPSNYGTDVKLTPNWEEIRLSIHTNRQLHPYWVSGWSSWDWDSSNDQDWIWTYNLTNSGDVITLPTASDFENYANGDTFGGWYTNSEFTGSPVTTWTDNGEPATLYLKWNAPVD